MGLFRKKRTVDTTGLDADAAAALQKLDNAVQRAPQDLRARRALADFLHHHHRDDDAVAHYEALAGAYAAQGLLFRAIAVCKTILEIAPERRETQHTLARLYARHDADSDVPEAVEISEQLGAALIVAEEPSSPPAGMPSVPQEGPPPMPADEADEADEAVLALDELVDVVDADTLAALTVRPEGSVVFDRPAAVPLFSGLKPDAFAALIGSLRCWEAEPGAVIVEEGEDGDSLFVIARGAVKVERRGRDAGGEPVTVELARLGSGDFFGEIALVVERPRAATVTALRRTELLEIDRAALADLVKTDPHVDAAIQGFCTRRLIESTVRTSPLFDGLDAEAAARVLARFERWQGSEGDDFICQGEPTPGLFVILSGEVDVVARAEIGHVRLKHLGAGDVCGEMGLLTGQPATASCVASSKVQAMRLSAEAFAELRRELPTLSLRLEALTDARAAFNERFLPATEAARTVTV